MLSRLFIAERERADLLAVVCDVYCDFISFPFGILGQVWYLIVSIPDPCCLSYVVAYVRTAKVPFYRYLKVFNLAPCKLSIF